MPKELIKNLEKEVETNLKDLSLSRIEKVLNIDISEDEDIIDISESNEQKEEEKEIDNNNHDDTFKDYNDNNNNIN